MFIKFFIFSVHKNYSFSLPHWKMKPTRKSIFLTGNNKLSKILELCVLKLKKKNLFDSQSICKNQPIPTKTEQQLINWNSIRNSYAFLEMCLTAFKNVHIYILNTIIKCPEKKEKHEIVYIMLIISGIAHAKEHMEKNDERRERNVEFNRIFASFSLSFKFTPIVTVLFEYT